MPAVLLLTFVLFAAGEGEKWPASLFTTAMVLLGLLAFVWGGWRAAHCVSEELRARTWDLQRLSALEPWTMTWGKLFGATVFAWYGAAICALVAVVAVKAGATRLPIGWVLLMLGAAALALHGAAMAASIQSTRRDSRIANVIAFFWILWAGSLLAIVPFQDEGGALTTDWFGWTLSTLPFYALSAAAFAAWGVLGAWREMSRALQVRTLPWAWPAFALFLAAYLAGLMYRPPQLGADKAIVLAGLLVSISLTYYALFADPTTAMAIRRMLTHAGRGEWRRLLEEMPLWPATLALAAAFAAASPFVAYDAPIEGLRRIASFAPAAFVLLAARDAGILVYFSLARKPRRVEAATLVYLILLSWILPGILVLMGLGDLASFVMPLGSLDGPRSALVMGVHAAIAWGLVVLRWRRLRAL
jgi:hypothetical protein